MEAKMDLTMFKEIPGYKAILKAVLKAQMQMLVDQLSEVEEESVILTASLSDGTLSYLGSLPGKTFLDGREEIKSQFLFHCLKRKTSTPVPTSDSLFVAGQSGTTMPNREPVFIPGGAGQGIPGQDQMFTDLRPLDSKSHHLESRSPHDERAAKKPRRTLPDLPPSLFGQGSELPAQFQPDMEASIQYQRGRGRARGALLGPGRGMVVPQGGPFGRGIVIGSVGSMGQGLSVGRGSPAGRGPTGRGAGSGRSRRARGQFPTRGRGRGIKRGATATVTSPDEVSVTSTADLDSVNKIEPDLVTVKAENFEVSIDLNSPVVKHIDATPVNIDMSPSVKLKRLPKPKQSDSSKKTSTPKKHSSDTDQKHGEKTEKDNSNGDIDNEIEKQDSVEQDNDDAFNDSTDEENDASEVPLDDCTKTKSADNSVNDSNVDTDDNSHNVSRVSIKQEVQDVEELLGMEAGALQESYRAPGPNGDRLNQTWGIMESGSMGSDGFDGGTPGPSQGGEEGNQSSGRKKFKRGRKKSSGQIPLTPEELAAKRRRTADRVKKWRERQKQRLGIDVYLNMQNMRQKKQYVSSQFLPEDKLEERRRQNRMRTMKYRQKKKILNYSLPVNLGLLKTEPKTELDTKLKTELKIM